MWRTAEISWGRREWTRHLRRCMLGLGWSENNISIYLFSCIGQLGLTCRIASGPRMWVTRSWIESLDKKCDFQQWQQLVVTKTQTWRDLEPKLVRPKTCPVRRIPLLGIPAYHLACSLVPLYAAACRRITPCEHTHAGSAPRLIA